MPLRLPKPAFYLTALFAFLGFVDSTYLTAGHYLALPLPCSLTEGCDTVLTSPYSMIGPVPLAAIGMGYYLLALLLAVYLYTSGDRRTLHPVHAICVLSGAGVLASAYFVYLQIAVIQAICQYCFGSALTSLLLFASSSFLLWQMRRQKRALKQPEDRF